MIVRIMAKTAPPAYQYHLVIETISPETMVVEEAEEAVANTIVQSQSAQAICPAPEEASAAEEALLQVRLAREGPTPAAVVAVATERG